jgi:hypothetical protein
VAIQAYFGLVSKIQIEFDFSIGGSSLIIWAHEFAGTCRQGHPAEGDGWRLKSDGVGFIFVGRKIGQLREK